MENKSYGHFSTFYDTLMSDVNYKDVSNRIDDLIIQYGKKRGTLLDLACGTGSVCEEMSQKGYDVIGADFSQEMLSVALDKKFDSGLPIQYVWQDMRKLDMYGTIDAIICTFDSLNHLENAEDIKTTFKRVSLFTELDGLFIFDVNTIYKHSKVLANNTFVYDCDNVYCVWQNYLNNDNSVDIQLDFFEKENDTYNRYTENFAEICLSEEEIEEMLKDCGFSVVAKFGGYTTDEVTNETERIVYVARKAS
ncbi:MAG: class I SAM-dependent methyltransferase [Clostridiales bacterium]|nr:class I SAM-dependent methyltransferase [Clostridiales bacterium]